MLSKLRRLAALIGIALGGCVGAPAHAADHGWVYDDGVARAAFAPSACKDADILERVKPEYRKNFSAGVVEAEGLRAKVCWIEKDGAVHFIAAEGMPGSVSLESPYLRRTNPI